MPRRALVLVLIPGLLAAAARPGHAQTGSAAFFPDAHTNAIRYGLVLAAAEPDGAAAALAPRGQEGYGKTTIEAANGGDADASATLRLYAKFDGAAAGLTGGAVAAGRTAAYDLSIMAGQAGGGSFAAELTSTAPIAALARTRWASGAGAAFEAAPAARSLLLPLMAVNVGSQSSVLVVQNAAPGAGSQADLMIHDPASGAPLVSFPEPLADHQVAEWDTSVEANLFGPETLSPNVGGGFLGALRVSGARNLALLGYIDEHAGPATAGIVGRPLDAAATVQVLPRVRAAADGGTLVAIANASDKAVEATLRYRAADGTAAGVPAERTFSLKGWGAAFVDLSPGGRSLPAAAAPAPFDGSAIVTASGPVLAAALEDVRVGGVVNTLAAYNAYGPRDLSTAWAVPVVRRATDFVSTAIVVHNPADGATTARLRLYDSSGQGRGDLALPLGPGATATVDLATAADFPIGTGRATIDADAPLAVVVFERRDASREYPPKPLDFMLEDERNSMVKGTARLTPEGADLKVSITLTEGNTGSSLTAQIQATTCSDEDAPALHPLTDVVAGRSQTTLHNVDLRALADGKHALRLLRSGGRFGGRVSCGIIPEVRGVEVADTTAVRALALVPGPDALPTAAPTAPPVATTAAPPPTATPGGATPTFVPEPPAARIFLPLAQRGLP